MGRRSAARRNVPGQSTLLSGARFDVVGAGGRWFSNLDYDLCVRIVRFYESRYNSHMHWGIRGADTLSVQVHNRGC